MSPVASSARQAAPKLLNLFLAEGGMKVELGQKVKDTITGFQGTVTGRAEYISGCHQALVAPPVKEDGSYVEAHWWDEDRLVVLDSPKVSMKVENPGCDKPAPKR